MSDWPLLGPPRLPRPIPPAAAQQRLLTARARAVARQDALVARCASRRLNRRSGPSGLAAALGNPNVSSSLDLQLPALQTALFFVLRFNLFRKEDGWMSGWMDAWRVI